MKNTKYATIGKVIMVSLKEFTRIVENETDGLKTVEYEFGPYIVHSGKAEETEVYDQRDINEILSAYFDVEVTSFHSDDCETPIVYIVYKGVDFPKPFMLLSTCERNTAQMRFQTFEEAQEQMKKEFEMFGGDEEAIEDQMAEFGEWSAWITDGNNHDDYDWQIIDLRDN